MKAYILYHGEMAAGIRASSFELDLGDLFNEGFSDYEEQREEAREAIKELAAIANDVPDSVLFQDELEAKENLLQK